MKDDKEEKTKITKRGVARRLAEIRFAQLCEDLEAVGLPDFALWAARDAVERREKKPKKPKGGKS